jgi:segregation and condensation protein B
MTMQDHDNDTNEKPEIAFTVDTTESIGEPVFPEDNLEASAEVSMVEVTAEVTAYESEDAAEVTEEETAEEAADESLEVEAEDGQGSDEEISVDAEISEEEDSSLGIKEELTLGGKIESIVFASPKPMRTVEIHELLIDQGYTLKEVQDTCDELIEFYRDRAGGFHLKYIKRMGYQFQTTAAAKSLMERQFSSRPRPLSRAALETLAVIAYRQKGSKGVTRAEVEFIRGVDAGSIFKTLVERNLLTCTGRKEIPGRPMIFGVTDEFLKVFQLGSINDLPPLESFQTPQDVLDAANQKIAEFEAEQEGVDTEEFIADEDYAAEVQSPEEFNPLAANAPSYAPTLERVDEAREAVSAAATDTAVEGVIAPEAETTDGESTEAVEAVEASPEESQADLIDVLNEGQVAWTATEVHTDERSIQGATVGEVIHSLDAIDEEEWDESVQVETTATEALLTEAPKSEAQPDERNETSEVAVPVGDSQPPRSGEVDQ